jgi:hypothetical protein
MPRGSINDSSRWDVRAGTILRLRRGPGLACAIRT